jgi:hypothetical protein
VDRCEEFLGVLIGWSMLMFASTSQQKLLKEGSMEVALWGPHLCLLSAVLIGSGSWLLSFMAFNLVHLESSMHLTPGGVQSSLALLVMLVLHCAYTWQRFSAPLSFSA